MRATGIAQTGASVGAGMSTHPAPRSPWAGSGLRGGVMIGRSPTHGSGVEGGAPAHDRARPLTLTDTGPAATETSNGSGPWLDRRSGHSI